MVKINGYYFTFPNLTIRFQVNNRYSSLFLSFFFYDILHYCCQMNEPHTTTTTKKKEIARKK